MQDILLTGTVTFMIALSGTVSNLLVLITAGNMISMNTSFGIITKSQALCNFLMCLMLLLYLFPMQVVSDPFLLDYSQFVGVVLMTLYEVSVASHLFIALNRLCTVFLPTRYDTFFSFQLTKYIRNGIWITSFSMCTILYHFIGCFFAFNAASRSMEFTESCEGLTWYTDFIFNTAMCVITLLINMITMYKAAVNSRIRTVKTGMFPSIGQQERKLNFLKQSFSQGTAIFTGQIAYYLVAPWLGDNVFEFLFATLWAYIHALEGFIILSTNSDIRKYLLQSVCKKWRSLVFTVKYSRIYKKIC